MNIVDCKITHKQKKVKIKNRYYNIDIKIIPLVRWLNSFQSVVTQFSCQGDKVQKRTTFLPYVSFFCEDSKDLNNIVRKINSVDDVNLHCYLDEDSGRTVYNMYFNCYKGMNDLIGRF